MKSSAQVTGYSLRLALKIHAANTGDPCYAIRLQRTNANVAYIVFVSEFAHFSFQNDGSSH